MEVLKFIEQLNKSDDYIKMIFNFGGCYKLYKLLKLVYPNAEPFINKEHTHIVTKINNYMYDIEGVVKDSSYIPLSLKIEKECEKWSFSNNYWLFKECPQCEEIIRIDKL